MLKKTIYLASLSLLAATASAQNLAANQAFISDENGRPSSVRVGESFFVTFKYRAEGVNTSYRATFDTGYARFRTDSISAGVGSNGEFSVTWGPVPTLMDRPFDLRVTLDADNELGETERSDNTASLRVVPRQNLVGLEYFNPKHLEANMSFHAQFVPGFEPQRLVVWVPQASTGSFQQLLSVANPTSSRVMMTTPTSQPLAVVDTTTTGGSGVFGNQTAQSIASSARVNSAILRKATFTQLARVSRSHAAWLQPETYIESTSREIGLAVNAALPANYKRRMGVYAVAERLYLDVLRRSTYTKTPTGLPSALNTLRTGQGDCGYLSALFVAYCRNAGIPARTVNGFTAGVDNWHVWAEFLVPGHGWVPVDPAYAEGYGADGTLPLYFGVIPELNQRFATGYGYDRSAMSLRLPMLQSPATFWFGENVRLEKFDVSCGLGEVAAP